MNPELIPDIIGLVNQSYELLWLYPFIWASIIVRKIFFL